MERAEIKKIQNVFNQEPRVALAYFFGSKAAGTDGPLSDYDFAVYFDTEDLMIMARARTSLFLNLSTVLATDAIDIVVLNTAQSPELKYNIIKEGILVFEREPFRVIVEPRILDEYFDLRDFLVRYGLTKA